jgi:protein TonB
VAAAPEILVPPRLVGGSGVDLARFYPPLAKRRREEGVVTVHFSISASGEILDVAVRRSSGFEDLDQAALAAARTRHFTPETRNGTPVAGSADEPFAFTLQQ